MSRDTQLEMHLDTRTMHSPSAGLLAPRRPTVCPYREVLLRVNSYFTTLHRQGFAMLLETPSLSLCPCFKGHLLVFVRVDYEALTLPRAVWILMLRLVALTKVKQSNVRRSYLGMLCSSMARPPLTSSRTIHKLSQYSRRSTQSHLTDVYTRVTSLRSHCSPKWNVSDEAAADFDFHRPVVLGVG